MFFSVIQFPCNFVSLNNQKPESSIHRNHIICSKQKHMEKWIHYGPLLITCIHAWWVPFCFVFFPGYSRFNGYSPSSIPSYLICTTAKVRIKETNIKLLHQGSPFSPKNCKLTLPIHMFVSCYKSCKIQGPCNMFHLVNRP